MFRLEVIDFFDQSNQVLVARVPESGSAAIQYGAQLIVQENQEAIFFRSGRAMDSFGPGRHVLTTENIPILTKILTIPWEKSPFQACVYFIAKHMFADQPWGTRQPITVRDKDFGVVRLRGFGKFSFRVTDASLFLNTIVGTQGRMSTREIGDYLKDIIVSGLTDLLATANISLLDLPAKFDEIGDMARLKLGDEFQKIGLELNKFLISSISPPKEVQKAIDARSSMAAIGDLQSYTIYQAANGMSNLGGGNGGGQNAGVGIGMGMMLPSILQQAMQQQNTARSTGTGSTGTGSTGTGSTGTGSATNTSPANNGFEPPRLDFSALKPPTLDESPRKMVLDLAHNSGWKILTDTDESLQLQIPVTAVRRQRVNVEFNQNDANGNQLISIWSVCGSANPQSATLLLRYNNSIVHGAFALHRIDDQEHLVLRSNLLSDTTDSLELSRIISAIAWQADQVESDTIGGDEL